MKLDNVKNNYLAMQPKQFTFIVNGAGRCQSEIAAMIFFIATTNKTKLCDGPSESFVSSVCFHLNNISTVGKNVADASRLPIVGRTRQTCPVCQLLYTVFAANVHKHSNRPLQKHLVVELRNQFEAKDGLGKRLVIFGV